MMEKHYKKLALSLIAAITLGASSNLAMSKGKHKNNKHDNKPSKEWYLSNSVSVKDTGGITFQGSSPAVLGRLVESEDGYDKHDIPVFSSVAEAKAAAVFIQEYWGDQSGEYLSDYHDTKGRRDRWDMNVVSTVTRGEVTLSWDPVALISSENNGEVQYQEQGTLHRKILKKLHLIDLETFQTIDAVSPDGTLNQYTFKMFDGETTRKFRWVLGPITSQAYTESAPTHKRKGRQ